MTKTVVFLTLLLMLAIQGLGQEFSACDANRDGQINVNDVQAVVNEALGLATPTHDLTHDGVVNVVDIETAITAVRGFGCAADPPPIITVLTPDGGITGTTIGLTVTGTYLDGSAFSTAPAAALTFKAAATFTSATGPATITGTPGLYAVVATNVAGSSSATLAAANRFIILDTTGEGDTFAITVLNTAAPPAGTRDPTAVANEANTPSISVLNEAAPPAGTPDPTGVANEASAPSVSVLNTAPPPPGTVDPTAVSNVSTSPAVAVLNTQAPPPGTPDPTVVANEADSSLVTVADPTGAPGLSGTPSVVAGSAAVLPAIRIYGAGESSRLIGGQTAVVGVEPSADPIREAQLFVNGVLFETLRAAPFEVTFTVPVGVDSLDLRFELRDAAGKEILAPAMRMPVVPDLRTEVSGRVIDATGQPLAGSQVTLEASGLLAEYFHFESPLVALPEVADLTPVKTTLISGLNLKNPQHVFGNDPLGLGLGPDYAARFRGEIGIGKGGGKYVFFLRSHKGARLTVDGERVLETPAGDGELAEANGEVRLGPGWHKIEVLYYETVGASQLDLEWAPPGESRQPIPPQNLRARDGSKTAVTDAAGEFRIPDVPSNLDQVQVAIQAAEPVTSAPVKPMPGAASRVGDVKIDKK